jgi:chemotaxis protein methyltransferase CheR
LEAKHLDLVNIQFGVSDFRVLREFLQQQLAIDIENYSFSFIRRRMTYVFAELKIKNTNELIQRLLLYPSERSNFLQMLEVPVTEFFREPSFWRKLKETLQNWNNTVPIRIWVPGITTGEELYSLLILIKECRLEAKVQVKATNKSSIPILKAAEGIITLADLEQSYRNFFSVFSREGFQDYLKSNSEIHSDLLKMVELEVLDHNIAYKEAHFDVIIFRNTLIYYNQMLCNNIIRQFYQSLRKGGLLCLGYIEKLDRLYGQNLFQPLDEKESIYRKL